jgi:hypothetical protein
MTQKQYSRINIKYSFADQKNVRTVIDLLIKFRASLAESKAAAIGTYQSNKEA